jgi:Tfp pilus assembly protein PilN
MPNNSATKNPIGIYISPKEICLAQTRLTGSGGLEAEHLVHIPTEFKAKEGLLRPLALNNDFFNEKSVWGNALQDSIRKVDWNASSAVVTLSSHFAILRYFVMPAVDRRFWNKSIPIESRKYIPVSFDEVVYDFNTCILDGGKKLGVLFGLTQRKSVEFILNTLKAVNVEMAAVEISPCSVERLFSFLDPQDHATKGYIHFSGTTSHMLFSNAGFPVLYRETDYAAVSTLSESRRLDVKGAVQYVDRYIGRSDYQHLMLSGDGVEVWKPIAMQESPIPVTIWDPARAAALKNNSSVSFFSMGASLRGRVKEKLSLDVSGIGASVRLEKQLQRYAWIITAGISGFLLLLSLVAQVRIAVMNANISSLSARLSSASELQNESSETISAKIEKLQTDANMLSNLASDINFLSVKLHAIADDIPGELWLKQIIYSDLFVVSELQGTSVELKLMGATALRRGEMQMLVVNRFRKALKSSPEFKVFSGADGVMEHSFSDAPTGQGFGAEADNLSDFTIQCSRRRRD